MENTRQDRVLTLICVATYFVVWLLVLSKGGSVSLLLPAFTLAAIHGGAHYYEMTVRGHVGLSADSTAFPAAFLSVLIGGGIAWLTGVPGEQVVDFLLSVPIAWIAGHAALFALMFLLDKFGIVK